MGCCIFMPFCCFFLLYNGANKHKQRVIDLPEEWSEVKTGDSLIVYKVTPDTIFIGFNNAKNR